MFEQINNGKLFETTTTNNIEDSAKMIIQIIVDGYLKLKNEKSVKEILDMYNLENKAGQLYGFHISIIQKIIKEELEIVGLSLEELVEKNGEKYIDGTLSNIETEILMNKVNNTAGILSVVEERTNK